MPKNYLFRFRKRLCIGLKKLVICTQIYFLTGWQALLKSTSLSVLSPPSRSSLWMNREDPGPLTYTWSFSHSVSPSLTQPYLTLGLRLAESKVPSEISVSSWTHYYSFLSWSLSSAWERGQMGLSLFSYALKYMKLKCVLVEDARNPCCSWCYFLGDVIY